MNKGLVLPMLTGDSLIDILKDQAKSLIFTKNKVELEVGDPKRKVFLEPLWLLNANPTQIDFQLRTFVSASEMKTLLADIKQAQIDITEMALQIAGSGLQLQSDDFLAGLKNGSLAYNKETKEVSQNGVVIYKAQPKTEPMETVEATIAQTFPSNQLVEKYGGPMTLEKIQAAQVQLEGGSGIASPVSTTKPKKTTAKKKAETILVNATEAVTRTSQKEGI